MSDLSCQSRNYFLACYSIALVQGNTILGGSIRSRTLRHYINDAKQLFTALKIPTRSHGNTDYIDIIYTAVKKYEKVANRRNMISDSMMTWLLSSSKESSLDSATSAIIDWIILGRYTGYRKSEWCQSSQTSFETVDEWPGKPPRAMMFGDFTFLDGKERRISFNTSCLTDDIYHVIIQWRFQKNGQNGEEVTFTRDMVNPQYCPVLAACRICFRALRLSTPKNEPIAVFSGKNKRLFITDRLITKILRESAMAVLNLGRDDKELSRWSTHSIRVTAANLLHRARFADSFIQKRLRWRSTSFLGYLRNTIYAGIQHSTGLHISDSNLPSMSERVYRKEEPHETVLIFST